LGYAYLNSQGIAELALPALQALSARINESCSMSVLEGKDIVYIARVPTRRIMTISLGVGARLPAFATSMGRILLGALDDEALASTLTDMDRPKYTPHTQTDVGTLTGLIREGQRQGWIITRQELELGLASIAVPVFRRNGEIAAAINVGVQARADVEDYLKATILPALRETAATLSRALTQRVG
jgi:IclR family pca regulon transcriptional regulator